MLAYLLLKRLISLDLFFFLFPRKLFRPPLPRDTSGIIKILAANVIRQLLIRKTLRAGLWLLSVLLIRSQFESPANFSRKKDQGAHLRILKTKVLVTGVRNDMKRDQLVKAFSGQSYDFTVLIHIS
jgi:hypothetical protein